jgi:hypothetical protein
LPEKTKPLFDLPAIARHAEQGFQKKVNLYRPKGEADYFFFLPAFFFVAFFAFFLAAIVTSLLE